MNELSYLLRADRRALDERRDAFRLEADRLEDLFAALRLDNRFAERLADLLAAFLRAAMLHLIFFFVRV
ncbi:hypothetical protein HY772_03355 [Candidatus Woesearchaeota archaeon]|nr:hypothetical protein [Candidatus Woesearchaeota archaeon]